LFRKILSEAERAWLRPFYERAGSEAEIGSSDFHAGEIACGFIEQSPEDQKFENNNFTSPRLKAPAREISDSRAQTGAVMLLGSI